MAYCELPDAVETIVAGWTDPDVPEQERVLSVSQDVAVITLVLSAAEILALTGFGSVSLLWAALALLAAGALLLWFSRRRSDEAA